MVESVAGGSNSVVESQPSKLLVAGSIPVSRSRPEVSALGCQRLSDVVGACDGGRGLAAEGSWLRAVKADVAQLAERVLGKDEVTGSIPVIGSSAGEAREASGDRLTRIRDARYHHVGVHRVQAPELQHDEEPEEDDRAAGDEEVLSLVPYAQAAPGGEVGAPEQVGRLGPRERRRDPRADTGQ